MAVCPQRILTEALYLLDILNQYPLSEETQERLENNMTELEDLKKILPHKVG